ncbi:MAG TPA: hypothetical protein VMS21_16150 [Methylomirabilota bacterium]|nr:hypothetical protein [Methylomirabilota bacterium]
MSPHEIYLEARRLGLEINARGDKLGVSPAGKCPPEFREVLKANKAALLAWLVAPKDTWAVGKYPPGEFEDVVESFPDPDRAVPGNRRRRVEDRTAAWLHVARQVLAGEFDGADFSTRESLRRGLRTLPHPAAMAALAKLRGGSK